MPVTPPDNSKTRDDVETAGKPDGPIYILGSGESMLSLTEQERQHVLCHTSIAMNKYLIFWEKVGIYPNYLFLRDTHHPAELIYQLSVRKAQQAKRPIHFYLGDRYRVIYGHEPFKPSRWFSTGRRLIHRALKHRFMYRPWMTPQAVSYFPAPPGWTASLTWATSMDQPMYCWRGSLSALINLACVIFPGRTIKLLGVDLGSPTSFYDEELRQSRHLWDEFVTLQMQGKSQRHMTAEVYQGMPSIIDRWPWIMEQAAMTGNRVVCCNPQSLIVTEANCPYESVMD